MPDHRGRRSHEYVYERAQEIEVARPSSSDDSLDGLIGLALFVGLCVVLWKFLLKPSSTTFTDTEMDAFHRAEQVKQDLAEVQGLVGPPKTTPDLSIAVTKSKT